MINVLFCNVFFGPSFILLMFIWYNIFPVESSISWPSSGFCSLMLYLSYLIWSDLVPGYKILLTVIFNILISKHSSLIIFSWYHQCFLFYLLLKSCSLMDRSLIMMTLYNHHYWSHFHDQFHLSFLSLLQRDLFVFKPVVVLSI